MEENVLMDAGTVINAITSIGTLITALGAAVAAVYAAIYTRRAAEASVKAAQEAANQGKELQILREPKAIVKIRIPGQLISDQEALVKYGRGNNQFRSGTPIYLDVWNASSPTIMISEVIVKVTDHPEPNWPAPSIEPQALVEAGKMIPINIAYRLMRHISGTFSSDQMIDFPNGTTAKGHFEVRYFSIDGERVAETDYDFAFVVDDDIIRFYPKPTTPVAGHFDDMI